MSERKPDHERNNRNPRTFPDTWLVADGKIRGPELPAGDWSEETKEFWNWLRGSAQAMLFQESDWHMMKSAIRIHNQMFTTKTVMSKNGEDVIEVACTPGELKGLNAEWRAATETYGFTRQSRARYGVNIITAEELETEAVQSQIKSTHTVVDYRKQYGGSN